MFGKKKDKIFGRNYADLDESEEDSDLSDYKAKDSSESNTDIKTYNNNNNKYKDNKKNLYSLGIGNSNANTASNNQKKYDVNNTSYKLLGNAINSASNFNPSNAFNNQKENKFGNFGNMGLSSSKKPDPYSISLGNFGINNTKKADPYASISLGNFGLSSSNNNKGTNKDSYNIDIDFNKINNEIKETNKKDIKKDEITFQQEAKPKKKKKDFFAELEDQLVKEEEKEEVIRKQEEELLFNYKDDDKIDKSHNSSFSYLNNSNIINKELDNDLNEIENKSDDSQYKLDQLNKSKSSDSYYNKYISNKSKSKSVSKNEEQEISKNEENEVLDHSDSTISIPGYNIQNLNNKIEKESIKSEIEEPINLQESQRSEDDNFSYNNFNLSQSKDNNNNNTIKTNRLDLGDKKSLAISHKDPIKEEKEDESKLNQEQTQNYDDFIDDKITSKSEIKYDDFDVSLKSESLSRKNELNLNEFKNLRRSTSEVFSSKEYNNDEIIKVDKEIKYQDLLLKTEESNKKEQETEKEVIAFKLKNKNSEKLNLIIEKSEISSEHANTKLFEEQLMHKNTDIIRKLIAEQLKEVIPQIEENVYKKEQPEILKMKEHTNLKEAALELYLRNISFNKAETFLLKDNKMKRFNLLKVDNLQDEFFLGTKMSKREIRELKLETALNEERKRRDFFELQCNQQKFLIEELENKVKKLQFTMIENTELKKLNFEIKQKYEELEADLVTAKENFEEQIKLIEDRIQQREAKNKNQKIMEITRNYDIDVDNLKSELNEKKDESKYLTEKCEFLEKENTKLSLNKLTNLETNDKIKSLQNENFIVHEKYNELLDKFERLSNEKDKIERQLTDKIVNEKLDERIEIKSGNNFFNAKNNNNIQSLKGSMINFNSEKEEEGNNNNLNVFDQLLIERESNIQETIIKSYIKEVERLNNEIKLLKNINQVNKNNNFFNEINEKPILKESAEEKTKILALNLQKAEINLNLLENEFVQNDIFKYGDCDLESFLKIFIDIFKLKIDKYDLIEVFNNFNRSKDNKIRYSDLINALKSKYPVNFFVQADPTYLQDLEKKIIESEAKNKDLLRQIESIQFNINEYDSKLKHSELEKEKLALKFDNLEKDKSSNQNIFNEIMKNNFLTTQGLSIQTNQQNMEKDLMIERLKNKIKDLENINLNILKEFDSKIKDYEDKFQNVKGQIEKSLKEEHDKITKEKIIQNEELHFEIKTLKDKLLKIELNFNSEINKLQDKNKKYKRNLLSQKTKLNKVEVEKQKILKLKGFDPIEINKIMHSEEIEILIKKSEELAKRYSDREEQYAQICRNSANNQIKKELIASNNKFEKERKEYQNIIANKNSELKEIKQEFEEIYFELQELKISNLKK